MLLALRGTRSVNRRAVQKACKSYPFMAELLHLPTASITNFLVTHSDVSDDLAYRMAKAMYDNIDTLYAAHNAAKAIKRENAIKGMPIPLHPGAEKYYREVGLIK